MSSGSNAKARVFAAPLYLAVGAWELWHARRAGQTRRVLVPVVGMGALTLLLVGPVLPEAMTVYLSPSAMAHLPADQATQARATYFEFPLSSVEALAGPVWLVVLSALAALLGVWRRSRLALLTVGWVLALLALGYAYLLNVPVLNLTNLGAVLIMLYLPMGFLLGAAVQALLALALARGWRWARGAASALVVAAALLMAPLRVSAVEPFRFFVTPADVPAMAWISEYTPPDALFAVNTTFWLPRAPHGTDAGYWIPYFTGRSTTASAMLLAQGQPNYVDEIVTLSHAEERLENDPAALEELRALGVDYIYIGARGDFSGPGLEAATLREEPGVRVVYEQAGVTILALGSR